MKLYLAILSTLLSLSNIDARNLRSVTPSDHQLYGAISASPDKDGKYAIQKKESPPVDTIKLFNILTSNNDIIVGDLQEDESYIMPNNVKICEASFDTKVRSPEYLSNPPPSLPDTYSEDGSYRYVNYKEDSSFGRRLQTTIDRTDDLMEQLYQAGMMSAVEVPSLMFDIDNTMEYTAYNDTDLTGDGPPLTATVNFVKKWCDGWGSGDRAIMQCIFITARYCTEMNAKATSTWLKSTYNASDELIASHVQFSGNLKCSCCEGNNVAYKDILRKDWIEQYGFSWIASIGDQYTDSVGHYSGIKIKLPNVWFDSSLLPNQYTQGTQVATNNDGLVFEEDWPQYCRVEPQAPIAPSPAHCLNSDALKHARRHASFGHCVAQTEKKVPDQVWGCDVDISTGRVSCKLQLDN